MFKNAFKKYVSYYISKHVLNMFKHVSACFNVSQ